jgi:hypothetical protein
VLPFAHLGIGANLVRPWWKKLPLRAILLGTLLPDLIDKPLYYVPAFWTGKRGAELGLISGTRSVGHTLLFLAVIFLLAAIPGGRRKWWLGLGVGVATHLALDNVPELLSEFSPYSGRIALLFPHYGWRFPLAHHRTATEHFLSHLGMFEICGEVLGLYLLWRLWIRTRKKLAY